jgi:hypothetical protein
MARPLILCALVLFPALGRADEPPAPTETVIRLTVQPMAAPQPALRYQLLPELREMNPGNPILGYLKCFMEQNNFFHNKESVDNREKWQTMPLGDLPKLRGYGGHALRRADDAARLDRPDFQILLKAKSDGIYLLVPELQQLRMLAAALKVRFRGEVAEKAFDEAIVTAKTMFGLSRHCAEHGTLISDLVGIAIAAVAIGPLDEMIGQPGCPNLYWALTDLPTPFVDLRRGLQGDRLMLLNVTDLIDETEPMSAAQLARALEKMDRVLKGFTEGEMPKEGTRAWVEAHAKDEPHVRAARRRLVATGFAEDLVKKFPPAQVVLLDEKREYELRRDDVMKWMMLPYWEIEAGTSRTPPARETEDALFAGLVSAFTKVRRAQARLEQRFALLRHVEAIRLYAAAHDGKPPAVLRDIAVPLPVDPFTGKSFLYQVKDNTAIVRGSPPKGEEKNMAYNVVYEVTLKK